MDNILSLRPNDPLRGHCIPPSFPNDPHRGHYYPLRYIYIYIFIFSLLVLSPSFYFSRLKSVISFRALVHAMEVKSILAPQTATTVQAVSSVNANQALLGTQVNRINYYNEYS